jgi:hypothetical protein
MYDYLFEFDATKTTFDSIREKKEKSVKNAVLFLKFVQGRFKN